MGGVPRTRENGSSPLMRQYLSIKQQHEDAILFFRMGDFYEMFFEDAEVAARELDLTLTARDKNADQKVPLCGFPHHQVKGYVHKLLEKGFKVAICDQTEDPKASRKAGKTLVERAVTRVLTPGLIVDEEALVARMPSFLAAVARRGGGGSASPGTVAFPGGSARTNGRIGLAFLDISTGELRVTEVDGEEEAWAEVRRLDPRELLLAASGVDLRSTADPLAALAAQAVPALPVTPRPAREFEVGRAGETLREQLGVASLDGQGLAGMDAGVAAAGAAIAYARENARAALAHVRRVQPYHRRDALLVDEATRRNLELFEASTGGRRGSLLDTMDGTVTSMGGRTVRDWLAAPSVDAAAIRQRLDAVAALLADPLSRTELRKDLGAIHDLPRILARLSTGVASPRDLKALRESLLRIPHVRHQVAGVRGDPEGSAKARIDFRGDPEGSAKARIDFRGDPEGSAKARAAPSGPFGRGAAEERISGEFGEGKGTGRLSAVHAGLDPCEEAAKDLRETLAEDPPLRVSDGGVIREGFDAELDEINAISRDAKGWIARMETRERERTGIASLKVRYNKVFGYFIEVTTSNLAKVPDDYLRKQTTSGGERYYTPELKSFEEKVVHAEEKRLAREHVIFEALKSRTAAFTERLLRTASAVAELDALAGFAERAAQALWVRPDVDDGDVIDVEAGRHPVVEQMGLAERFVPNDVRLDGEARLLILTGPNMAGKSTVMRQTALLTLMAQCGSFVPARRARIGVVDRIFTRVGASDMLSRGQSTFMVEMSETANILNNATPKSLVIIDEIGRGTSTFDGVSIAWAVAEHLHDVVGAKTLFATHYHELTALAGPKEKARNFHISVKEWNEQIIFLRKLVEGGTSRSYGIQVARLAGLPTSVLDRAREVLADMTGTSPAPRLPHAGTGEAGSNRLDGQMSLFGGGDDALRAELRALEIDGITPLEALTILAKLKEKA